MEHPFEPWIDQLLHDHRPLPLVAQLVMVISDVSWAPAIGLGVTLPALLLPDGRLRSSTPIDNPFGLAGLPGTVAKVVGLFGVALHWASLPAAAVCGLLRFRASRGTERQQLRWVAAGAAGFQPLRRRVQDLVDRRFNRRRYDAARTADAFAVRLRDQVDLDALHGELLAVVDQTVSPNQAWLWLRPFGSRSSAREPATAAG